MIGSKGFVQSFQGWCGTIEFSVRPVLVSILGLGSIRLIYVILLKYLISRII